MIEHLKGCFETERLSGSEIQARQSKLHIFPGDLLEVTFLWKILSEQTVGVFIGTPFPGSVGMSEVVFELEQLSNLFMIGELLARIRSQSMDLVSDRKEQSTNLILHGLGSSLRDFTQQGKARFSLSQGHEGLFLIFSEHSIHFPIAQALSVSNNGGTLFDRATIE